MNLDELLEHLRGQVGNAVAFYWNTRGSQARSQHERGTTDQGTRAAVTGGAQMNGFLDILAHGLRTIGVPSESIHFHQRLELPGFFRATKMWDLLVVIEGQLILALEAKSQVGSFGNNFNNRTEEAMGSALDLWTAFREGAFRNSSAPWLGYLFMLQDCPASRSPVRAKEPHFPVFPEFKEASYAARYELFCRKLVRERHYSASAYLLSSADTGLQGEYAEPAGDLTMALFLRSLLSHASAFVR